MARPLVFATRRPPWPPDNGARIRSLRLAQGLARRFELTLVTFRDGPAFDETQATRADLERALPDARIELLDYGGPAPGGARRNALSRRSATFGHYDRPALRAALARTPADAVLHLDDPGVALAGLDAPAALVAFAPHNVEHRIIRAIGRRLPLTHRPFVALEWRKLAAEERRAWRAADLAVAVSAVDADTLRGGGARAVILAPNGSDPHEAIPLPPLAPAGELRLLFVGSLRFAPYAHALAWFVREALPLAREHAGPVLLDVVGEHGGDMPAAEGVVYHGRVPEVGPHYERAHALVLPVFEGSGTRLKVVEAALFGRPIVSTALGVEGLGLDERHYLRAGDARGFALALAQLRSELEDGAAAAARAAAARAALAGLTWPRIAERLADDYEAQITSVR